MKFLQTYKEQNEFYNESLRDKMTPKSDEELLNSYTELFQNINNPLSDYPANISPEFQKIADLFNVDKKDLHIVAEDDNIYMAEYFYSLISSSEQEIKIKSKETETEYGGVWLCYPDKKLARWISDDFDEREAWIINKEYFNNQLKESLRDKMVGKSNDEILQKTKDMDPVVFAKKTDQGKIGDLDIPIESQPLIFQIWNDFKNRYPESVTKELDIRYMGSFGRNVEFSAILNRRSLWIVQNKITKSVMFKIHPFKKIRKLRKIRVANNYMLINMEQYNELIKHL